MLLYSLCVLSFMIWTIMALHSFFVYILKLMKLFGICSHTETLHCNPAIISLLLILFFDPLVQGLVYMFENKWIKINLLYAFFPFRLVFSFWLLCHVLIVVSGLLQVELGKLLRILDQTLYSKYIVDCSYLLNTS